MEQTAPATVATAAPTDAPEADPQASAAMPAGPPGFGERGRMRRRARFLRKARELAYRDLGGLVFNLHRFAQRNDALVMGKLGTLGQIDTELRALERALGEHQTVTVLRDAGIAACPRCAAIHGSEDRFCPNCGLAMDRRAERPMAGPPQSAGASQPAPAPPPGPASPVLAGAAPTSSGAQARPVSDPPAGQPGIDPSADAEGTPAPPQAAGSPRDVSREASPESPTVIVGPSSPNA